MPTQVNNLTPAQRASYDRFPANLTRYLLLTKSSTDPFLDLAVSFRGARISPRCRETVILRVGGFRNCAYEAMQHRDIALSAGIDEDTIKKLLDPCANFEDPAIQALVHYVDSALNNTTTPEVVAALKQYFDDGQIAEIALLTGFYAMTAIFLQTLDVPLDSKPTSWENIERGTTHLGSRSEI